ncbi:formimidoylglutamate deiminase [Isoptericola croceus]|uniref:formimidoylglutamate deiminase n=1 Tax=Isoptericola croceus TaxID=3031406 RepID=UPI0023F6C3D7|nr:formimidoylglutamate deiminase [Isoptericola croceus]
MSVTWCRRALVGGRFEEGVRIEADASGRVTRLTAGAGGDDAGLRLGTVVPGFGNAHSHLFHRALRGRTHADGGDFWSWREQMYAVAGTLDPDRYRALAVAVFAEMRAAGYTAVGEFHYVHHRPDGTPYPDHEMELALADASEEAGIRLTLLDTCYLRGGLDRPLEPGQRRFGDGSAAAWLERWHRLRDRLGDRRLVTLGAAVHSVRAVTEADVATIVAGLPAGTPLHAHVSEQPLENEECLARTGLTPTGLLARAGALGSRLTAVHATHLTDTDVALLGGAGVSVALCPTTEADLADGIGPARTLAGAGVRVAIGSDQNAVIDPLLELRAAEAHERLASGRRGVFDPADLWLMGTAHGYTSLGLGDPRAVPGLAVGDHCDLVELDDASPRTVGSRPDQLVLTATAADVRTVVVGGRVRPAPDVAALLAGALERVSTS